MTTGERIRAERRKAGMTQAELGVKLGLSGSAVAQWEKNYRKPKEKTICRIAAALGVSPHDISPEIKPDELTDEAFLARISNLRPTAHNDMGGKSELAFHGLTARWRDAVGLYGSPTCSNCGSGAALKTRFCPHCGAKMEDVT